MIKNYIPTEATKKVLGALNGLTDSECQKALDSAASILKRRSMSLMFSASPEEIDLMVSEENKFCKPLISSLLGEKG